MSEDKKKDKKELIANKEIQKQKDQLVIMADILLLVVALIITEYIP